MACTLHPENLSRLSSSRFAGVARGVEGEEESGERANCNEVVKAAKTILTMAAFVRRRALKPLCLEAI